MKCTHVKDLLDDYADGYILLPEQQAIAQHLTGCAHCRVHLEQLNRLRHTLKNIPLPEPSPHFENRILDSLAAAKSSRPTSKRTLALPAFNSWIAAGLGGAITAFLILWVTTFNNTGRSPSLDTLTVNLVTNQVQHINLAFNSRYEINNATFQIELPKNIDLKGHQGKRTLQWQATLKQGANRLTLPLIATSLISGENDKLFVIARIIHDGKSREFKIKIITRAQQSNNNRILNGTIIDA